MGYVRQFGMILLFSFLGEGLRALLGLPVPAGIYGLVLMQGALKSSILRLEQVKDVGTFLLEAMPVMFIPAAVPLCLDVDYSAYEEGAKYLSDRLTPAAVCLAVPLYQQLELLEKNWKAVLGGIFAGTLASWSVCWRCRRCSA